MRGCPSPPHPFPVPASGKVSQLQATVQSQEGTIQSQENTIAQQQAAIQALEAAGTAAELERALEAAYQEGVESNG